MLDQVIDVVRVINYPWPSPIQEDTTASLRSRSVQFDLESCDGGVKKKKTVTAQTTKCVTGNIHAINWVAEKNRRPHLSAVHFQPLRRRPIIDKLIGLDYTVL